MRTLTLLLLLVLVFAHSSAFALSDFRDEWRAIYPDSNSDDIGGSPLASENGCQLCHRDLSGGQPWNNYGWQIRTIYRTNGFDINAAIRSVEIDNLDGNTIGANSLDQIIADFQPGWANGNVNTHYFADGSTNLNQPPPPTPISTAVDFPEAVSNPLADIAIGSKSVRLVEVASDFNAPLKAVSAPGINGSLFVVEQTGKIFRVELTTGRKTLFLDVSDDLVSISPVYDERGLLGLAFHPDYANNGLFYTYQSEPVRESQTKQVGFSTLGTRFNPDHRSMIVEYRASDASCNSRVQKQKVLMIIDQPQSNHNGGDLAFGPDGYLYVSLGDGGGANDQGPGHNVRGTARDNTNVLGSILRIDPQGSNAVNGKFGVPSDNPFVGNQGADEIFAYGFRNPYRMSFDAVTGELYAGDVGQNRIEEVDLVVSGGNYGWNWKEGSFNFYYPISATYVSNVPPPGLPNDLIEPIAEYDHDDGISVVGGFVYRGSEIPELFNHYVLGEFSGSDFLSPTGRLLYLDRGSDGDLKEFILNTAISDYVTGFGQDVENELYVVVNDQFNPGGQAGKLLRLANTSGSLNFPSAEGESEVCTLTENDDLCFPIKASNGSFALICL